MSNRCNGTTVVLGKRPRRKNDVGRLEGCSPSSARAVGEGPTFLNGVSPHFDRLGSVPFVVHDPL